MAFLEKEEPKASAFWDWVIGIALIVVVGGFTLFYQYQKRISSQGFKDADSLFLAGQYKAASTAYEELKSAQYLTSYHDSLIYLRLDSIESLKENEEEGVNRIRTLLAAGDTLGAKQTLNSIPWHGLAAADLQLTLDSIKKALP